MRLVNGNSRTTVKGKGRIKLMSLAPWTREEGDDAQEDLQEIVGVSYPYFTFRETKTEGKVKEGRGAGSWLTEKVFSACWATAWSDRFS